MSNQIQTDVETKQLRLGKQLQDLNDRHRRARVLLIVSLVAHFMALASTIIAGIKASKLTQEIGQVEADLKGGGRWRRVAPNDSENCPLL